MKKALRHRGIKALSRKGTEEEIHMDLQDGQDKRLKREKARGNVFSSQ